MLIRTDAIEASRLPRLVLCTLLLVGSGACLWTAATAPAATGAVKVRVLTGKQDTLLRSGALRVRVGSSRAAKVSLSARQGKRRGLTRRKALVFRKPGKQVAKLRLSKRGRSALGVCGPQLVTVEARIGGGIKRWRPPKPQAAASRKGVARDSRKLAAGSRRCTLHLSLESPDRCDPIDAAHCLAPFPNDFFTIPDSSTQTGRRVRLIRASMPDNQQGDRVNPGELNRNDGFSPNSPILARVPGIESEHAFEVNGIVPQTNIGDYARADQRVMLINASTGARHPIWAELDETTVDDLDPSNDGDRMLIIRPAEALDYGQRYVVALRNLTAGDGAPLDSSPVFKAYRDGVRTDSAEVEARRGHMESVFSALAQAGIARKSLYLAWDLTVSSRQSLTGRLRAMRDNAFAQLGDLDLGDRTLDGDAPAIDVLTSADYALCDADGQPECAAGESDYAFRKVAGTVEVPCYMDAQSAFTPAPGSPQPCGPGSRLNYQPGAETPSQNGASTFAAPITCLIPRADVGSTEMAVGKPGLVFGHGLLGDDSAVEGLRLFPGALEAVACGTPWIGMSSSDVTSLFLLQVLQDLSKFPALADRSQQGMLDMLYLARAMAHPDGLADQPELQGPGGGALAPVDDRVGFLGASQGGIFGGATTAVAPDWDNAVLGVPGMGFSTLLTRSTQFNQFLPIVYNAYRDPIERQIAYALLQMLWDRGETSGYVHGMTTDELPNSPEHEVLLIEAFGDHQVTNVQTQAEARTIDAVVRSPILTPSRSPDVVPYWDIAREPSSSFSAPGGYQGAATLFVFDTGQIRVEDWDGDGDEEVVGTNPNPISNRAPRDATGLAFSQWFDGLDPHEPVASSPGAQALATGFLTGGGVPDPCLTPLGTAIPCNSPPIHVLGEGL